MNMTEIWKDIKDYEGLYQVSNLGRVRSLDRIRKGKNGSVCTLKGRILKMRINNCGYFFVILCKNGIKKPYLVHRLVALAFIENPDPINFKEINHKDENKANNCVDNLEWCDRLYQVRYGSCIEKSKATRKKNYIPKPKIKIKKHILQYTKDGICVGEYKNCNDAQKQTGLNASCIRRCVENKLKTSGGYVWKKVFIKVITNFKIS